MKYFVTLALIVTMAAASTVCGQDDGFKPLFNGTDLDGWVRVNTDESTWSVKDGMLLCSGKPTGELRTTRMYQNFIMEVEWRHMKPRGNAGIFVWADDITARGVPFHRSIEVQVLENAYGNTRGYTTHGDIFPIHGAKMKPINGRGGSRAFPIENRSNPSPEWNQYRIECRDGSISLAVNGKVVTRGTECSPRKGYICIESEGGVAHYRNLRIKRLPDTPIDEEHVAIADRGFRCLYTGIDLDGWKSEGKWQPSDWVLKCQSDKPGWLATQETFDAGAFIFDIKFGKKFAATKFEFASAVLEIDSENKAIADQLAKAGTWNRFEGEVREGKWMFKVNGVSIPSQNVLVVSEPMPMRFVTSGQIELANIYVR